jgi:hypothetical protein
MRFHSEMNAKMKQSWYRRNKHDSLIFFPIFIVKKSGINNAKDWRTPGPHHGDRMVTVTFSIGGGCVCSVLPAQPKSKPYLNSQIAVFTPTDPARLVRTESVPCDINNPVMKPPRYSDLHISQTLPKTNKINKVRLGFCWARAGVWGAPQVVGRGRMGTWCGTPLPALLALLALSSVWVVWRAAFWEHGAIGREMHMPDICVI